MPTAEPEIRELIRTRLVTGDLPRNVQYQIFGGKGDGVRCVCCDQPIGPHQVLYEVLSANKYGDGAALAMHLPCFNAWLIESASPNDTKRQSR